MQVASLRPAPPAPVPKPGKVKVFKALYTYEARQPDELSFEEGDVLYVTDSSNSDWWKATCKGRSGLIPSNYVSEQAESIDFPLHEAAKRGNLSFLQECLANRVSVNSLDKSGSTAIYWASHAGHVDCLKVLLAVPGVNITEQNKLGDTALHAAAWKGHLAPTQMLLEAGASPNCRNTEGKTPRDLAKDPDVAALLNRVSGTQSLQALDDYAESEPDSD